MQFVLQKHFKRTILSALAAIPGIIFGTWLLHYEVSHHDMNAQLAPVINWPLMTVIAFFANAALAFRDSELPTKKALKRWFVMSFAHICVTYSVYTLMVHIAGLRYLFVSLFVALVVGPLFYVVRISWVFAMDLRDQSTKIE